MLVREAGGGAHPRKNLVLKYGRAGLGSCWFLAVARPVGQAHVHTPANRASLGPRPGQRMQGVIWMALGLTAST